MVTITFVVIPSIMVSLFFVMPDQMFLDGDTIPDAHQRAVFRNIARSNACGDTLAIVICCFLLRTKDLSVLWVCITALTIWIGLENIMVLVELLTYGHITDPIGDAVDFFDFLLMLYMFVRLCKHMTREQPEATPLIA